MAIFRRSLFSALLMVLLSHVLAQSASAQEMAAVSPGDGQIVGTVIEPYVNRWNVYVVHRDGEENLVRIWSDYVQIMENQGRSRLHRVQDLYSPDYHLQQTWINVVDHESLKPVRFSLYENSGGYQKIDFWPDSLQYRSRDSKGTLHSGWHRLDNPVFDWNLYGILLAALPFDQGSKFQIPFWSPNSLTVENLIVEIGAEEEVDTDTGKSIHARKVSTDRGLTFWLIKSPPYVISLRLNMENGSEMVWRMADS